MTNLQHMVLYTVLGLMLVGGFFAYGKVERDKGAAEAKVLATEARLDSAKRALGDTIQARMTKEHTDSVANATRAASYGRERGLLLSMLDSVRAHARDTTLHMYAFPQREIAYTDQVQHTIAAADTALHACSVVNQDCMARATAWERRYAIADSLATIYRGQRPSWLQREEGPLCGALAVGGFVLGWRASR